MNNKERELWVMNDEPLYLWWQSTKLPMTKFLKEKRQSIDRYIKALTDRRRYGISESPTGRLEKTKPAFQHVTPNMGREPRK